MVVLLDLIPILLSFMVICVILFKIYLHNYHYKVIVIITRALPFLLSHAPTQYRELLVDERLPFDTSCFIASWSQSQRRLILPCMNFSPIMLAITREPPEVLRNPLFIVDQRCVYFCRFQLSQKQSQNPPKDLQNNILSASSHSRPEVRIFAWFPRYWACTGNTMKGSRLWFIGKVVSLI